MKKSLVLLVAVFTVFCAVNVFACGSSGLQSSDAAISATAGELCGSLIVTDGTNDATIIVYDHPTAASGTVLFKGKVAGAANFGGATWELPIKFTRGVYVDVTGTGAAYIIYYRQ